MIEALLAATAAVGTFPVREAGLIFGAGLGAGMINSIAGGGTLLSFPVLLWLGRDPVLANVANAVALSPGSLAAAFAYRRELRAAPRLLAWMLPASVVGAVLGAYFLLATPARWFNVIVPVLILLATGLLALRRPLLRMLATTFGPTAANPAAAAAPAKPRAGLWGLAAGQLAVAIYGGYFGAAIGIIMLATLALWGLDDIHQRNGLKNACSAVINAVAGGFFAVQGAVNWFDAGFLGVGAIAGGYLGGILGRRLDQRVAEAVVVAIGLVAAAVQLLRLR